MPQKEQPTEIVYVTLPSTLLQHFCDFVEIKEGDTVGDLGDGFVTNTVCGKKYQAQVNEQRQFIKGIVPEGETND